ncbi:MAG TPA: ATP-binding protein [Myxococcales bacterium]
MVRAALPLTEVDDTLARLRGLAATAALVMLGAGATLAGAAAHWTSRSLRRLTAAARTMISGDLSVRTGVGGRDEVASLSQALDTLGQSLSESMGALRGERDLRDRILVGMREGVLLLDGAGRVLLVNPALRELLGLRPDAEGQPLLDEIRHGQLGDLLGRAERGGGEISEEIEFLGRRPRRLLVHVARPRGDPPGLLAVFFDVTDLRRLETLRRDFVANASHELRTPIAAVRSAAETLSDALREDPQASAGFVEMIQRNSERLQRLVDDLLDLSRIESRELELSAEPVALGAAAERVVSLFQDKAQRRGLRLSVQVPAELKPARADPRALEQVLTNLVDNAVKYCVEGAAITVRASPAGEQLELSVADTGPGIEARHLPRLFERFYRVDAGRSRELGGTGLGLSIVKHLVEAMHGSVSVESEVGRGSRFLVRLPLADAAPGRSKAG